MTPKGKKTSTFDPAVPSFDRQTSFSLPVPSGSDSPFSAASTPTGTTSPTKGQRSYKPPSLQLRELSAQHLRPSPHHHCHHQPLGLPQGLRNNPFPPLPPTLRAPHGPKSLIGPRSPPCSRERRPQQLHPLSPRNP